MSSPTRARSVPSSSTPVATCRRISRRPRSTGSRSSWCSRRTSTPTFSRATSNWLPPPGRRSGTAMSPSPSSNPGALPTESDTASATSPSRSVTPRATRPNRFRSWSTSTPTTRRRTPCSPATPCSSATSAVPTCCRRSVSPLTNSPASSTTRSTSGCSPCPTQPGSSLRTAPVPPAARTSRPIRRRPSVSSVPATTPCSR